MIEQRKTVTVVFADLVESTSLAERHDPEVLAGILRRYFAALRAVIERHGGSVEKFIGDAVVGVFGVPVLHEDDALRAVRAALAMQAAVGALNSGLDSSLGTQLRIRVGVNTGEVVVSAENAMGHAISMAARLEQGATAGDVLVGRDTYALLGAAVDGEPVDALTVKGSTQPLAAWRVTGVRQVPPRGSSATGMYIGRDRELRQIAAAFDSALSQPACVTVTVAAPPGLGKTRLVTEAVSRIGDTARVLAGRCLPYGDGITYAPLVEALAQLEADDGPDVVDRALAGQSDAEQVIARVRATIAGAASGSPDETAWAFRRLFDALAAERPLIVVLDDIHWADPLLLDLIEYVGTFSIGSPMLLLCTARPDLFDARPDWSAPRENAMLLRLAPLTETEVEGLLADVVGHELNAEARRRIVETAGGVPLFVEQMAAFDAESESGTRVPPTIRALLAARVDLLSTDERRLLEHAAIQGPTFRRDMVAALLPEDARGALGSQLMSLIRREFIRPERAHDGQDAFGFNHGLIRDAVYDQMSRRTRAGLHERYADILAAATEAPAELLGYHLERAYRELAVLGESGPDVADLALRAGSALASAGRAATARFEANRAVELLSRARALLSLDPAIQVTVMPNLIDAYVGVPDLAAAELVHDEAVTLARSLNDEANELRAEIAWAITAPRRDAIGWQERQLDLIDRAIDHFQRINDHGGLARVLLLKGLALGPTDQPLAIDTLKQAQLHAEQTDDERIQVEVWDELGGTMLFGPTPYQETLAFTRREVAWARERSIAFSVADGRLGEAYSLAALGEYDDALALLEELRDFFAQLPGRVSQHGECYTLAGRIERDRGNPEAAAALYQRAMELFEQSGHRRWWLNAAPGVVHALLDLGRVDEAKEVLDLIAASAVAGSWPGGFRLEAEARYRARTGDSVGGVELARRALNGVAGTGAPQYEGRARETLAGLLETAGDVSGAHNEYALARACYVEKGYLPGIARIDKRPAASPV